ncbi:MAG: asparagine synthase (glutamine-hydrolyzing) [Candidatus Neomarinimicrobiota bacterium]
MCGILGELVVKGDLCSKDLFMNLLSMSKNRGPDYSEYYNNEQYIQLGFNRLSILDLSNVGNQPMQSQSGRYVMVYNGEIYNYLEIKDMLIKDGIKFKGTGDSEVIIEAFDCFGIDKTVKMLDGMFAIGLFDKKRKNLHLIRDFAGIKPLYYGFNNRKIVFASQYDQIAKHPSFSNQSINPEVLKLYFSQHFIPAPYGLLENTYQIMPGEIVTFNIGGKKIHDRYWELPINNYHSINDSKFALEYIGECLNNTVKAELISDVPVSAFLSGGIDSPLICHYAQKNLDNKLNAVSIGSDSIVHDETFRANNYAKLIGIKHTNVNLDGKSTLDNFTEIIKSIKEPFADISLIPTFIASKIAKENASVVLSGDGGDELFFGYERFSSIAKNIRIQNYPYLMKYGIYAIDRLMWSNKHYNSACLFSSQGNAHYNLHNRFSNKRICELMPYLKEINNPNSYLTYNYENTKDELTLLQNIRHAEFYGMMQKTLRKIDLASMANSLEIRVPFLKKSFIEQSLKINPYLSISRNQSGIFEKKQILKKLLAHNIPESSIDNIKKGFSVPLRKWISDDLMNPISEVLLDQDLIKYFGMEIKGIENLLKEHKDNQFDHKWPIFTIFSILSWRNNLLQG